MTTTQELQVKIDQYLALIPLVGRGEARKKSNLSLAAIRGLRIERQGFSLDEELAHQARIADVETRLEEIALGKVDDPKAPEVTAARAVLAANQEKYQVTTKHELTGAGGGPIGVKAIDEEKVDEAIRQIDSKMRRLPSGTDAASTTPQQ